MIEGYQNSISGLKSWKCTGILIENETEEYKLKVTNDIKLIHKKMGIKEDPTSKTVNSFDYPHQFITAMKGDVTLFANRMIKDGSEKKINDPADKATLNKITKEGTCSLTKGGKSFEFIGDREGKLRRDLAKSQPQMGSTDGLYVQPIGITPTEAITKLGFQYVREESNPKYGKVYVFEGKTLQYPSTIAFDIAPEFGFRIVHSVMTSPKGEKLREYHAVTISKVQGYWLPEESEYDTYVPLLKTNPSIVKTYRFMNRTVNDVTDDFLGVKLDPGDYKWDEKTNSTWKAGAKGEMIYQDYSVKNSPKTTTSGWLYMATVGTLLVLTIGAYIWWKRNQLSKYV